MGANLLVAFPYFNFEKNYDVPKSKSPWTLLNKNINFNKSVMERKVENHTHSFRETNLVFQLILESQIKSNTLINWSSRKKKKVFFVSFVLSEGNSLNIFVCIFSKCIVYWILNTLSEYTYFYISKDITSYTFSLAFKIAESQSGYLSLKTV